MKELQKRIWDNKVKHNFNTTNVYQEFCYIYGEVAEAFDAWYKSKGNVGEELADVAIYLFGLSEMLNINLLDEVNKKVAINEKRIYKKINGADIKQ